MADWEWLKARPKSWALSFSQAFSWPDASRDICLACGKQRRFHRREDDHEFAEKEDAKEK